MITLKTKSPAETKALGEKIGRRLQGGEVIALIGELGAGKTCLTQGFALGLGISSREYVNSPSFTLVNEYRGRIPLYHFDLFRLKDAGEVEELGYEEYFYGDGVTIIEWAGKAESLLPEEYLRVELTSPGGDQRLIKLQPLGQRYREVLKNIR